MRSIKLDVSIDLPLHAVQLSTGQLVVSHEGSTQHRVLTVDSQSGQIIKSYGGPEGSSVGQLNSPKCLAIDSNDNIFVADFGNNRITLLGPSMNHLGDIKFNKEKLSSPMIVHLDEDNGRLYIGEWSGRLLVLVFSSSPNPDIKQMKSAPNNI